MKMKRHGILYLIADRRQGDRKILEALDAGVDIVQLREKERNSAEYLEDAVWLGREAGKRGILFLVNDRLDIALASGADGVHLGQADLPVRQARQIAEQKMPDLNAANIDSATSMICGSARSMGIEVVD